MIRKTEELSASARVLAASLTELKGALALKGSEKSAALQRYYFPVASSKAKYALAAINFALMAMAVVWIGASGLESFRSFGSVGFARAACMTLGAIFCADFMSACFHKWLDSFASEASPIFGSPARAFRIHHEFPSNLNDATYWHNVSAFATLTSSLIVLAAMSWAVFRFDFVVAWSLWVMIALFANGTEIHRQSHLRSVGAVIGLCQRVGLFLRPASHARHHAGASDVDYGIINGWSNVLTRRLSLWARIDRIAWDSFGVLPKNWLHAPDSMPDDVLDGFLFAPESVPDELTVMLEHFPGRAQGRAARLVVRSQRLAR